jgi:hypothetical protein
VDTTPPSVTTPDLLSDTGVSNTDNITNDDTPTFQATAEAGSHLLLFQGAQTLAIGGVASGGADNLTLSIQPGGVYNVQARAIDVAGNIADSSALAVTIDLTDPTITAARNESPNANN